MNEVVEIDISKIVPNKSQPRLTFYDDSVKSLALSIQKNGLLQPISVRKQADGHYELIAGERRYRACLYNGAKKIKAIIYDMSDKESAALSLIENIQREDLNAIEQAMAMKRIMKDEKITQKELATRLGYKQSTVANKIRLLKLPDYVKEAISKNLISERHARALLKVPNERLEEVFKTIIERQYNVAKSEEYIKNILKTNKHTLGISSNVQIGINTINRAYDMIKKSGIDADYQITEYGDNVKIIIRFKK